MNRAGIAFVDVDHTLIDCSSEREFLLHLAGSGIVGPKGIARFLSGYLLHPLRTLSDGPGWNRGYLAGQPADAIRNEARAFCRRILIPRIRPSLRAEVETLSSRGIEIRLLSASLEWLLEPLLPEVGAVSVTGSLPGSEGGVLTGRTEDPRPWGEAKRDIALSQCSGSGVDPASCVAFGDSWSDRHLLESVGSAVAVHPSRRLARLATERGWRIMERPR